MYLSHTLVNTITVTSHKHYDVLYHWQLTRLFNSWFRIMAKKHKRSTLLAFCRGIHWWLGDSPHKGQVLRSLFPCHEVIMSGLQWPPDAGSSAAIILTPVACQYMLLLYVKYDYEALFAYHIWRWFKGFNSLWPSDTICWDRIASTVAQIMACCLMAPSHYLNQCWLIISEVLWHASEGIIIRRSEDQENKVDIVILKLHPDLQGTNDFTYTVKFLYNMFYNKMMLNKSWIWSIHDTGQTPNRQHRSLLGLIRGKLDSVRITL